MMLLSRSTGLVVFVILSINVKYLLASCYSPSTSGRTNFLPIEEQNIGDKCVSQKHKCDPEDRYYSLGGECNNLQVTTWGETNTPYIRLFAANYSDGISGVRTYLLPLPRKIRTTVLTNFEKRAKPYNMMFNALGQFTTHDVTKAVPVTSTESCCPEDPKETSKPNELCLPIDIPVDDKFYSKRGITCLEGTRIMNTHMQGCKISPSVPINNVTSALDLSFLYSSDGTTAKKLRSFNSGKLLVNKQQGKNMFQPMCPGSAPRNFCAHSGDSRAMLNPELFSMQKMFLEGHNRFAAILQEKYPNWDDEKCYQEARRILIACYQNIVYKELFPAYIGTSMAKEYKLMPASTGYVDGYDPKLNIQTYLEYAFCAARVHHTMVPGTVGYQNSEGNFTFYQLREKYNDQSFLYEKDTFSHLMKAYMMQYSNRQSEHYSPDVTDYLFKSPNRDFGLDLAAIDINRGRDSGIPPYNKVREACGLKRYNSFREFASESIDPEMAGRFKTLYKSMDDVELYPGSMYEKPMKGALLGSTLACIVTQASYRWKWGDRKYYEFPTARFSQDQLKFLRGFTFAHFLCLVNDFVYVLKYALKAPSDSNPLIRCSELCYKNLSAF